MIAVIAYDFPDIPAWTYDLSGREVATIASDRFSAGVHRLWWDADGLPSGVYLIRLTAGDNTRDAKVILIR